MALMSSALFMSCKKDVQENISAVNETGNNKTFFIDQKPVTEEEFTFQTEGMLILEEHKPAVNQAVENDEMIENRAFSSEERYIAYGKEIGLNFEQQLQAEKLLSEYAVKSGAIEAYEKTGEVSEKFKAFEAKVIADLGLNDASRANIFITLFDKAYVPGNPTGPKVIMATTQLPVMYPWWDNRVSCVEFVGLGGAITIFDRTFYRRKLKTVVNWGMTRINLPWNVNNKMSSALKI